ncbi:putative oxidoreductase [Gemmata obscuriglobus]|uniref:Gfo/Idh/MocA family oxidoreductase n=1 Tax=Gemmata obscuriglobus TaxID=114 RepID=A0A2Z3HAL3_9BACT|nr:Gfo/Idh/MocA family oxidoreductase [Gemmata obscuriglobus]AWM40706.1 gfo/Idh/MocA family oxidoreductase [Gemmata obscuriglobus]QEG26025.1 putative oxidoreductase [Gemmata obscuriglobus]VTS00358.1 3-chlorobenzoate- -dioxygenase dehydrogenase : Oxidoreductase domain protein OS=Pirellula staleyi (strain ATCC 27377 / DSM 6068 / ICPB 4128) GN=Psta_2300 PE=4 SV=1: GFO_IDH_MocA [Gemmata obscuriglobus UQM 2246]
MARKYRVGVIGATGRGDYGHAVDVAFRKLDNVEIVAVADASEAGRVAAQKRTGAPRTYAAYKDLLAKEKPDLVAVCPRWIDQRHDMLMAAAEAGCHIYTEKPFWRTLKECDAVADALDMRHLKLGIAHISQYSPVLDTVLKVIADGVIGDLLEVRARGKEDARGGGEDLWVLGSHVFGLMRSVAGGNAVSCYATVAAQGRAVGRADVKDGAEGLGPLAGDHVQATYAFPKGVQGYFASRKGAAGAPTRFAVQVFGSKGVIELESGYLVKAALLRDAGWSPARSGAKWQSITSAGIDKPEPRTDGTYEGGHVAAITDLIGAIEQRRETKCTARDATAIVEMIAAVFESHRLGKPTELPLKTRVNPLTLL